MELYQLRTFKMVAELGHLTRAAKRLNASQPAVSAHIKSLEEELGLNLFLRTPKGMVLTIEGQRLKKHAEKVLSVVEDMASQAESLKGKLSGNLKIGLNSEPELLRIREVFSTMRVNHPQLAIHLLQSMTAEVKNKLEDGLLDAGFVYGNTQYASIYSCELARLPMVVAGPLDWQEKLSSASPADLALLPWIMTPFDCPFHTVTEQFFAKYSISPQQVAVADQEATIKTMIKAGIGVSLFLEHDVAREGDKDFAVWHKEKFTMTLSIACLKRRKSEPALQHLFSILGKIWEK